MMPSPTKMNDEWWENDQTPDNPYDKNEDYEAFLDDWRALDRNLTPEIAAEPLMIDKSSERHSLYPVT